MDDDHAQRPIELSPVIVDGVHTLVDQHGRPLRGMRSLVLNGEYEDAVTATVKLLCYREGKVYKWMRR